MMSEPFVLTCPCGNIRLLPTTSATTTYSSAHQKSSYRPQLVSCLVCGVQCFSTDQSPDSSSIKIIPSTSLVSRPNYPTEQITDPNYSAAFDLIIPTPNTRHQRLRLTAAELEEAKQRLRAKSKQYLDHRRMEMELKIEDYKRQLQQQHANLAARLESDINQLLGEQSISPADTQDSTSTAMNPTNGNEQQQQQQPNEEIDPFKMDETILNNHPIENVVDMSDSDDNNDESNELTDVNNSAAVMLMSTSLPIRIPMTTAAGTSANQSRHGDNESEQFTPPHILSAQTFRQTSSLSVFGDLPPPSSSVRISIALKDSNR